jgi:hypothetical protein
MKLSPIFAITVLLCTLVSPVTAQDSQWSLTKGVNILEAGPADIHVKQRDPKDTNAFALARKPLHLTGAAWRVAFDVRYGELQPVGSTVKLGIGDTLIGAIGGDQKGITVYLGNDTSKYLQPTDSVWHHFEFVCDGVTSSVWHNGVKVKEEPTQGKPDTLIVGAWSEGKWLGQQTELWMRNLECSNSDLPSPVQLPPRAGIPAIKSPFIPIRSADTNVTCQVGDRLQIAGSVTMDGIFDSCLLMADGAVAATRTPSVPTDDYSFTWTPETAGTHTLELRYTNLHSKSIVRRLLITAADTPPAVISDLPGSAVADTQVTVIGVGSHPFPLARVDFYFNDKPISAVTAAPFAATLPVEQITQPGSYPVRFIAYDAAGHPFHSHSSFINIPQRVQVTAPRTFTLRSAGDKANLTASVLPNIKVSKVSFSIVHADASHFETLADVTSAPYSANVDLSSRASGDYWVRAIATSAAGNSYEAWAVQVTLINIPDDERNAQEIKERAAVEAKAASIAAENAKRQGASDHDAAERAANLQVFAPRPGYDEAIFRDQLVRLASYEPGLRRGTVGTVHALAVLTINDEAVTGIPFTVSALVRPGSGQVTFLANAADDTRLAVQQAAEYCKMLTAPQQWDWSKYDLTVGYDRNDIKSSGPSAGLADAVAILSCSFKLPVDNSVAMTGAVTLQGQVQPVGGVDFKAEAAFNDPAIHTIIVPAGTVSSEDLTRLYISEPALCFSRRVVMVNTVEEAGKEAIVGWSHSNYIKEETLVQGGLRHFAKGEDKLAVAAFQAAHDIDPNNWTASFWIAMIDLVHKQHAEDAMAAQTAANNKIFGIK